MSQRNLRHKPRISYYEPEEPDLDEYVFCEKCGDYVYEYCAIHGPLLVIPDDKVPAKPNVPPYVPRAALTIPHVFLHITYSIIPDAGLGVFTSMALPSGVRFGPYQGQRTDVVDSSYCWQIYDKDRKPLHCIDAADANKSNWMRYVNCARHWREQNLVAYQYQGELYYRTIKIIPRYTELMVFYGSEFACELDVDLGKYNSPTGYAQKFGAPVAKKRKPNDDHAKIETQEEIQTRNFEMANTQVPTSAKGAIIKDITSEMQNGQVNLTSIGSGQVGENYTTKSDDIKGEKSRKKAVTKNSQVNKSNGVISTKNNKTSKVAQTKQDGACVHLKPHNIERDESKNNDINLNKVEFKTNLAAQNNVLDLYIYCDSCNKKCATRQELKTHLRFHDLNRKYVCEICNLRYTSISSLNDHSNIHRINKDYEFTICSKIHTRNDNLKSHMRTHTEEKRYACEVCNARFNQNSDLKTHMRTHTGEKPYACEVCNARFNENGNLKIHMRTHTGEKPYACEVCNARFNHNSNLKKHMRTHTGEKPYACEVCNARFNHNSNLKKHMRTHTGEKPYACEVCNARFNHNSNLKKHMRTHTGEKPYACEVCNARFNQNSDLKRHMRTHTGEKPYACEVCNARFNENGSLKRHMRTHIGEKPYACEVCNARFNENGNLKTHMRTHTGEKPYGCEVCNARFNKNGSLKKHMRTHTGEKPYACEVCNARFNENGNLKTHMRTHTGEKPYACEVCNARFNKNGSLKKHMRTHTGEKPYACEICEEKFTYTASLKNHLVKIHLGDKSNQKPTT